jgi:L-ascorbate metabolism protein UlaG (beta-lactamase superfamily)
MRKVLPLLSYPCGEVLSYRFVCDAVSFHHFGSVGATERELSDLARYPLDILLLPLQGHTKILDLAFVYVERLRPRCIIPHHHDDFFPPIRKKADIRSFTKRVNIYFPKIEVKELAINGSTAF